MAKTTLSRKPANLADLPESGHLLLLSDQQQDNIKLSGVNISTSSFMRLGMREAEITAINATQAAAKLGVDVRTLYEHFGDIAREMTQRFRAHIHQERVLRFEYKCNLYRQSAEKLVRQGKRPTSRLVALDLKGKETVCPGIQREACVRICREVTQSS